MESGYTVKTKLKIEDGFIVSKGYSLTPSSVIEEKTISKEARFLYVYLLCKAGANNCCYPANKTIMEALGIKSIISLRKYKNELLSKGLITIKERKQKSGKLTSNYYYPIKMKMSKSKVDECLEDDMD